MLVCISTLVLFKVRLIDFRKLGSVGWRTLVPVSAISHIPDISLTVTNWWRGAGSAIYMSPVDELSNLEHMEVSCRSVNEPEVPGETVSWGKPVGNEKVLSRFQVN